LYYAIASTTTFFSIQYPSNSIHSTLLSAALRAIGMPQRPEAPQVLDCKEMWDVLVMTIVELRVRATPTSQPLAPCIAIRQPEREITGELSCNDLTIYILYDYEPFLHP
jgi:hypothetical protein